MYLYGLHVPQLGGDPELTGATTLPWHPVHLESCCGPAPRSTGVRWTDDSAELTASGDLSVLVERGDRLSVTVTAQREVPVHEVVHPLMSFVGGVIAFWTGRSALHAASVVLHDRAWLLLAAPDGGKSTLAAVLAARGHAVLGDDLAVLDGTRVLAGARSADLREASAVQLGAGHLTSRPSGVTRWRTELGPAPREVPLGGMVVLEWGAAHAVRRLAAAEHLRALAVHDALGQGPGRPEGHLDLLSTPGYALVRPRTWAALEETVASLGRLAAG